MVHCKDVIEMKSGGCVRVKPRSRGKNQDVNENAFRAFVETPQRSRMNRGEGNTTKQGNGLESCRRSCRRGADAIFTVSGPSPGVGKCRNRCVPNRVPHATHSVPPLTGKLIYDEHAATASAVERHDRTNLHNGHRITYKFMQGADRYVSGGAQTSSVQSSRHASGYDAIPKHCGNMQGSFGSPRLGMEPSRHPPGGASKIAPTSSSLLSAKPSLLPLDLRECNSCINERPIPLSACRSHTLLSASVS